MAFRNRHARLYTIEINDEKIDEEIGELLFKVERHVRELSTVVKQGDIPSKVSDQRQLLSLFTDLKREVDRIRADMDRIVDLELEKKRYIVIKDQNFVKDKRSQLDTMRRNLEDLIEILREDPSGKEYQRDVMDTLNSRLDAFIGAMARIRQDDQALAEIYASLDQL